MGNISGFIKRHPVVTYFVLAYAIAWGIILMVAGSKGFQADRFELPDVMLMFLAMLIGPSLSGISLTAVLDGKKGLQALFSRMGHWRVGLRWYAVALLFPVLIITVLTALSAVVSPVFAPGFTGIGLVFGLAAGFFEEIGWTGFALPKLQLKRSPLAASLQLGGLWGFWHLLADYFGNSANMRELWLPYFVFGFVAAMTATRVLIAWVYNRTGSLWLAQLMHASSTGFLYALGISATSPFGASGYALSFVIYAAAIWIVVAILIARTGKQLTRPTIQAQVVQTKRSSLITPD
jgi:membrane protease YdiL (CAAX protease family)